MSGVMLKMGILGLVRLLSWIPDPPFWWGAVLMALGALSGILGVAFALGQHDLKRLLAYHSIENIGIILLGLGLGTLGKSTGHPVIQVLGFAGALLHVLNHSLFKGLLFLAAGSVVHAVGTRDLERMGGLGRRMPWTSAAFLAGSWAISGLPPLNGFVSEWFIYLGSFRALGFFRWPWSLVVLTALALIGALAMACFAKAYGTVFQGSPRTEAAGAAHESPRSMLVPMGILAGACASIGLAPMLMAPALDRVVAALSEGTDRAAPLRARSPAEPHHPGPGAAGIRRSVVAMAEAPGLTGEPAHLGLRVCRRESPHAVHGFFLRGWARGGPALGALAQVPRREGGRVLPRRSAF